MTREALDLKISGVVQGVGFRPFVYREAKKRDITGWVLNDVEGVKVHAEGETLPLDRFVLALSEEAPAAAQVSEIEIAEVPVQGFDAFEIRFSDAAEQGKDLLRQAEERAALRAQEIAREAEAESRRQREQAEQHLDETAEFIVERVVKH